MENYRKPCRIKGFLSTGNVDRFLFIHRHAQISNPVTIQEDTVVWVMGIPPKIGMVKYTNAPSTLTFMLTFHLTF